MVRRPADCTPSIAFFEGTQIKPGDMHVKFLSLTEEQDLFLKIERKYSVVRGCSDGLEIIPRVCTVIMNG